MMEKMMNYLLFALLLLLFPVYSQGLTDPRDVRAMRELKAALGYSGSELPAASTSCLATWDFRYDPCDNKFSEKFVCGFDCDDQQPLHRVITINLDSFGYRGHLPPTSLSLLSALTTLQLSGNAISGPIPHSLSLLHSLTLLDLSSNAFVGSIPSSLGGLTNLRLLNLRSNSLRGTIPASLNNLINLEELRLDTNNLTGILPRLSHLSSLKLMDISDNALSGAIPLNLPPSLSSILLRNNQLTGLIPHKSLIKLRQLNVLDLSGNEISGPLDSSLLSHPTLQQLNLSNNKLTMLILPTNDVAVRSQIVAVDLSYNIISGSLPAYFSAMPKLCSLSLRYNFFTGSIPSQYGLKALARLMLDGNYLVGPLPESFYRLQTGLTGPAGFMSLVDNCFDSCPPRFFFCQGGSQKTETLCRLFNATP